MKLPAIFAELRAALQRALHPDAPSSDIDMEGRAGPGGDALADPVAPVRDPAPSADAAGKAAPLDAAAPLVAGVGAPLYAAAPVVAGEAAPLDAAAPVVNRGALPGPDRPIDEPLAHIGLSSVAFVPAAHGRFLRCSYSGPAGMRAYKLYVPRSYDERQPCPLVVMLHGCSQSPDDFAIGTRMNELADEATFLAAYPEQSVSANASKCWNWYNTRDQHRDGGEPSIVAGIVARIVNDYAVDATRVYAAGMSAGAAAAAVLAAAYPDVFAAIGVHSGLACGVAHDARSALAAMRGADCIGDLTQPRAGEIPIAVPTIVFHGDRDVTVHPRNGERFFAEPILAACERTVIDARVPGGRTYTKTTFTDADGRAMLEQWVVHGAGHAWSGGSIAGSYTDPRGPDASREMLRFFLGHRLPARPDGPLIGAPQR